MPNQWQLVSNQWVSTRLLPRASTTSRFSEWNEKRTLEWKCDSDSEMCNTFFPCYLQTWSLTFPFAYQIYQCQFTPCSYCISYLINLLGSLMFIDHGSWWLDWWPGFIWSWTTALAGSSFSTSAVPDDSQKGARGPVQGGSSWLFKGALDCLATATGSVWDIRFEYPEGFSHATLKIAIWNKYE